jgi:hypothetical protein
VRRLASQLVTWISAGLLGAVVFGPVGQFAVELAREKGWYDDPSRGLETIVAWFGSFVTQTPFFGGDGALRWAGYRTMARHLSALPGEAVWSYAISEPS